MNDSAEATFAYTVKSEVTEKPWKDVDAKYSIYELVDAPQDGDVVLLYNLQRQRKGNLSHQEAATQAITYLLRE